MSLSSSTALELRFVSVSVPSYLPECVPDWTTKIHLAMHKLSNESLLLLLCFISYQIYGHKKKGGIQRMYLLWGKSLKITSNILAWFSMMADLMREGPGSINLTSTVYSNNNGKQQRNLLSGAEKENVLQHHDATSMYYMCPLVPDMWLSNCLKLKMVNSDPFESLRSGSTIKRLCDMILTIMRSADLFASKHKVIWCILNDLPTMIYSFKLITWLSKERLPAPYMIDLLKIPPWKLQQDILLKQKNQGPNKKLNMLPMSRQFQYTNTSF